MMRTTFAAIGGLVLLTGAAFAEPPPNDVGVTGMGGGVYFNPYKGKVISPPFDHLRLSDLAFAMQRR